MDFPNSRFYGFERSQSGREHWASDYYAPGWEFKYSQQHAGRRLRQGIPRFCSRSHESHLHTRPGRCHTLPISFSAEVRFDHFDLQYHNNRYVSDLCRIDNLVSPRFGIILKPSAPLSTYYRYSVSYLPSSGNQFSSLTNITEQVKPEKFENTEVGVKWDASLYLCFYQCRVSVGSDQYAGHRAHDLTRNHSDQKHPSEWSRAGRDWQISPANGRWLVAMHVKTYTSPGRLLQHWRDREWRRCQMAAPVRGQ